MNKPRIVSSSILNKLQQRKNPKVTNRNKNSMLIAAKIINALKEMGISKTQFAEQIGKKPSVITRWLSGTHNFTSDTLSDIEVVLNIKMFNLAELPNEKLVDKSNYQHRIRIQSGWQELTCMTDYFKKLDDSENQNEPKKIKMKNVSEKIASIQRHFLHEHSGIVTRDSASFHAITFVTIQDSLKNVIPSLYSKEVNDPTTVINIFGELEEK